MWDILLTSPAASEPWIAGGGGGHGGGGGGSAAAAAAASGGESCKSCIIVVPRMPLVLLSLHSQELPAMSVP